MARAAAEAVAKRLGQPVIIENKPGAGAIVGADFVAKAKPDGYTWLIAAAGVVTNSMLRADMPYADSDLVPVGMIAVAPSVIVVNPSVPANNLKEFVAWVKTQGGGINWATAGSGSTPHFVAEMLREAGVNLTIVPYKSGSEGMTAVLANNVHATSEASIVVLPQVKAGKLKAVATTYSKRISAYDALPTAREQGFPGVLIGHWAGLFAPKGTPPAIVERMSKELEAAVRSAEFHDKMVPARAWRARSALSHLCVRDDIRCIARCGPPILLGSVNLCAERRRGMPWPARIPQHCARHGDQIGIVRLDDRFGLLGVGDESNGHCRD
jgi:tripartite-type tricarboxylate transporter receptor subunit TctC